MTGQQVDEEIIRLRSRGLSYHAITVVLDEYHGWRLTVARYRVTA